VPELGTTRPQGLNSVDGDFQTRYVAAEQAYGAGDFQTAQAITSALLAELDPLPDATEERHAALAWQAFVALLAGHIHLYGLQQPDQAHGLYSLVLSSHPPDTLRQLAEQGLERLAEQTTATADPTAQPEPAPTQASLISDPFLAASSSEATQAGISQAQTTATPWLELTPEPVTQPEPVVEQDPLPDPATIQDEAFTEEPITDAAAEAPEPNVPEANSSPPVPEGLLQKLKAGRLRVDL